MSHMTLRAWHVISLLLLLAASVCAEFQAEGSRCNVFAKADGRQVFNLVGAKLTRVVAAPPPFDATDCWLMKSRYNCQNSNEPKDYIPAWEWKLSAEGKEPDFLENMVRKAGGVLESFYSARGRCYAGVPAGDVPGGPTGPANIVFMGNSFIRQVFESIACKFKRSVIGGRIQLKGPTLNLTNMADTFDHSKFQLYNLPLDGQMTPECHGPRGAVHHYYESKFRPNQTLDMCNDDHAMVSYTTEAGHQVNVYMVFRAYASSTLTENLHRMFGLRPEDIHGLVVNNNWGFYKDRSFFLERRDNFYREFFEAHRQRGCRHNKPFIANFNHVRSASQRLFKSMSSHAGRNLWPGAHNPGVPFDVSHACMPGIAYQEQLLLGLMYAKNFRLAQQHLLPQKDDPVEGCAFNLLETL